MKTEKILNGMNKFVWDIIWYGFFVLLVVIVVAKPPMLFNSYYYTDGYSNPYITQHNKFEAPEGAIELTKDSEIVKFYNTIIPRIEFLRHALILWFIYMFIKSQRYWILQHLDPPEKKGWQKVINFFERYKRWI